LFGGVFDEKKKAAMVNQKEKKGKNLVIKF
jgi:hypothetical protein